jgi:hypothetical protein
VGLTLGLLLDAGIIAWALRKPEPEQTTPAAAVTEADPLASCPTRAQLRVVAPELVVPMVEAAAASTCTEVEVTTAGGRPGVVASKDTDLWITDSEVWEVARQQRAVDPVSIASSPIVATADPALADDLGGSRMNWRQILQSGRGFSVGLYDPSQTATGVLAAWPILQAERNVNDVPFTSLALTTNALMDPTIIPAGGLSAPRMRTLVLTGEYAVTPAPDTRVLRGIPGEAWLDFPAYNLATDTTARAAVDRLVEELSSDRLSAIRAEAHLREPDGTANFDTTGLGEPTKRLRTPSRGTVYKLFGLGASGSTRGRLLVLLDVSASMGEIQSNGRPLLDNVRDTAMIAMSSLYDHTSIGVELMSSDAGPEGHRTLVPLAPLSENRQDITDAVAGITASPTGGSTVYPSILDGYRTLLDGFDPGAAQSLVILTDGRDPESSGMTLRELRRQLRQEQVPGHRIRVMGIGFGKDADVQGFKQLSQSLGGASAQVNGPIQMLGVFITMVGQVAAAG